MTGETGTFYLAGGYINVERHASIARGIAAICGWRCTARWLVGQEGESDDEIARNDRADLEAADALVVVDGPSGRNSTWVEMGIALGLRKPVVIVMSGLRMFRGSRCSGPCRNVL